MAQSFVQNLQHIIFSTKNRSQWIDESWEKNLYAYIGGMLRGVECKMKAAGGASGHIHILAAINKKIPITDVIRAIKSSSTNWIKRTVTNRGEFSWQQGYAAFSVSQSQFGKVENYTRNQREHHQCIEYKDELRKMLDKHELDYDEKYLWL